MLKRPIFIMSSERSGSNLLRVLLDNHSELHSPAAPQFLNEFSSFIHYYGNLNDEQNCKILFEDMLSVINHKYHSWDLNLNYDSFCKIVNEKSFLRVWEYFYSEKLKSVNKSRIVCKENNIFSYAPYLTTKFSDARFIYLYRDPRDYVASWMKVPFGISSAKEGIGRWLKEQKECLKFTSYYPDRVVNVSYEELIDDTEKAMSRILKFCDLPVEDSCFQTDQNKNKEQEWNVYWKNLSKPIIRENRKKYLSELSGEELSYIEYTGKELMTFLNYPLETKGAYVQPKRQKLQRFVYLFRRKNTSVPNLQKPNENEGNVILEDRIQLIARIQSRIKERYYLKTEKVNG